MKYYLAPLEGITGFVFRNAYEKAYGEVDKYFAPFVAPNQPAKLAPKEKRDLDPANNNTLYLVPQILGNDAEIFKATARHIAALGYREINLNLGCPSGTVTSKFRGSGFLRLPEQLDNFLEEIYTVNDISLSVKTRIGYEDYNEFPRLLDIYNKYPIKELIIHPRLRMDMYKNPVNMDAFKYAYEHSVNPLCYNGDLFTRADVERIIAHFPKINALMFGRGVLMNPGLVYELKNTTLPDENRLRIFLDQLLAGYQEIIPDQKNILMKLKEVWFYLQNFFPEDTKLFKKVKKINSLEEYKVFVDIALSYTH